MAFDVQFTEAAARDIDEILAFLTRRAAKHTQEWLNGLFEAIETLQEMPSRHSLIAEASRLKRPLRSLLFQAHRVVYEVNETRSVVFIVRIYHMSRAPLRLEDLT